MVHKTGAVEQHVDRANLGRKLGDRLLVGGVELPRGDAVDAGKLGERPGLEIGGPDLRALARERDGRSLAHALSRRGDECNLAPQSAAHRISPFSF